MGIFFTLLHKARHLHPFVRFRGLKVPVTGTHVSRSVLKHLWKGGYERPEIDALQAMLRDGDRVLELGTGMGVMSGVLAKANPGVSFRGFEANPALMSPIAELHRINGITNVTVVNAVLLPDPEHETVRFNLHANFTESSLMSEIKTTAGVDVPVQDFCAELATFRPDILVCDIEGGEEALFRGISLAGLRGVVIELHPQLVTRAGIKQIYATCAEAGLYPRVEWSSQTVVAFERVPV